MFSYRMMAIYHKTLFPLPRVCVVKSDLWYSALNHKRNGDRHASTMCRMLSTLFFNPVGTCFSRAYVLLLFNFFCVHDCSTGGWLSWAER